MTGYDRTRDTQIRNAAFQWLASQCSIYGEVLPRSLLADGFDLDDQRIRLLGPQGIFKPKAMAVPLSIATVPSGPYGDAFGSDNLLQYEYRGTDPDHRDNRGLRLAMRDRLPLAYFHRILPGKYLAVWPAFVVGDAPERLTFSVDLAAAESNLLAPVEWQAVGSEVRREYAIVEVKRRLHQGEFRERVLRAYRHQCALCRLRHEVLLDAAHIIPDSEPDGAPEVNNGLALCRPAPRRVRPVLCGDSGGLRHTGPARCPPGTRRAHAATLDSGAAQSADHLAAETGGKAGDRFARGEV